jgi:glutaredoxin 3
MSPFGLDSLFGYNERQSRKKDAAMSEMNSEKVDEEPIVTLYCTSWCPDCRRARQWLAEHRIAYREIDISKDRDAAARVRGWARGNETTPTFDCGGTIIVNFDEHALKKTLNK